MELTPELVRGLVEEYVGVTLADAELQRVLPAIQRQQERMRELQALDLGGEDPLTMDYIVDRRLQP